MRVKHAIPAPGLNSAIWKRQRQRRRADAHSVPSFCSENGRIYGPGAVGKLSSCTGNCTLFDLESGAAFVASWSGGRPTQDAAWG